MGTRELKGLLRVLKDAGVASYTDGDLSLTFHDRSPQGPVVAAQPDEAPAGDNLDLPDGLFNPLEKLAEINRKAAQRS